LGLGKRLLGIEPAALAKVLEGMFDHAGSSTQQAGQTAIIINLCRHWIEVREVTLRTPLNHTNWRGAGGQQVWIGARCRHTSWELRRSGLATLLELEFLALDHREHVRIGESSSGKNLALTHHFTTWYY